MCNLAYSKGDGVQVDQTLALMLLQALVASDPTSHFAAAVSTAGLPQYLLNELARSVIAALVSS